MKSISELDAAALLQREAALLDMQRWDDWLDLYEEDCLFWVPSWRDDHALIDNPRAEVSFLYLRGKTALAERVRRVVQGKSITTHPLPRTSHQVSLPIWLEDDRLPESGAWHSQWVSHQYDPRTSEQKMLFGRYRHAFSQRSDTWKIREKVVTLINDRIATVLDFYSV
ncbi:MAG: aromatic-ring-hydroxylating dioxygenase subunit beta [Pigmentiphaga sp.]|nr:aromatic-ring-hydroxylating dioxygenase subunit beta [Pigmentiphaga sp.]